MKNLTWQNPEQLFVAQILINKVKSKCCGIKEKEINKLFVEEKLYLNPQLKLSDVARQVGTNRTYLSRFFNQEKQMTFYDYVNNLRVDHAVGLLQKSNLRLNVIAEQSGFNSISTFRRVFAAKQQCTPSEYRKRFL